MVHQDKLKTYHAPNPANWEKPDQEQKPPADAEEGPRGTSQEDQPSGSTGVADIFDVEAELQGPPEKRRRKPSVRFKDYEVDGPTPSTSTRNFDGSNQWVQNHPHNVPGQQLPAAPFVFSETPNFQSHGPVQRQTPRPTSPNERGRRGPGQVNNQWQQKRTRVPPMRFLDYVM